MRLLAGSIAAIAVTAAASGGVLTDWDVHISFNGGSWLASNNPGTWTVETVTNPEGKEIFRVIGSHSTANWGCDWTIDLDPDPFISSNVNITNNSGILSNFSVTTTLPVFPTFPGPNTMQGSISGSVLDADGVMDQFGNGATVRTMGGLPWYEAIIDNATVRTQYDDFSQQFAGLAQTNAITKANFGPEPAPANLVNIGIRNNFQLTPGDSVNFVSTFLVVPSPGAGALLAIAGVMAVRRRRA